MIIKKNTNNLKMNQVNHKIDANCNNNEMKKKRRKTQFHIFKLKMK